MVANALHTQGQYQTRKDDAAGTCIDDLLRSVLRGSMLFAFSNGGAGADYWKFMFTGPAIGTAGGMIVFIGINTSIIQSFPLSAAGVGGSFANIIFQVGGVIGIAVQSGLLGTGDGTIQDWTGAKNSYIFTGAYIMVTSLIFLAWYRHQRVWRFFRP